MIRNIKTGLTVLAALGGLGLMTVPAFAGTLNWSGTVDDTATIRLRGRELHVEANRKGVWDERGEITGVLPHHDWHVELRDVRGRGTVQIVQQPDERNHFTAIVRINDYQAGADRYHFRLVWRDRDGDGWGPDRDDRPRDRDGDQRF